jgi:predicted glycoside hydrolase/deacetylase ChbG (UPF0249 family)
MSARQVIINADDFGQSPGVNRGIIQAHESGLLTSASLMVRWPAAGEAAEYARRRPELGVGLHLDFGEWMLQEGEWVARYEVVDEADHRLVATEIGRQIDACERLLGRPPSHIDSHQHRHLREPARSIVLECAQRMGIAVRSISVPYCGRFYGQDEHGMTHPEWISAAAIRGILTSLTDPVVEIGCHPAAADDLDTMYRTERLTELETLCDPGLPAFVRSAGIELRSFRDWNPV